MKAVTAEPFSMTEMLNLTKKDALYTINGKKVRIMFWSPNQELEMDKVEFDENSGRWWGLRKVNGNDKHYNYLAGLVKRW